ncbi:MAG TPA: hypothetical protein VFW33_21775 [Gemmataceae bacterium]|nr:hypothetical protein [Gemmataceae bacterium]
MLSSDRLSAPGNRAADRADRLDPGWTLEEIEATRPTVLDGENGALVVMKARRLLPRAWSPEKFGAAWKNQPPQALLNDDQAKALRDEMSRVAPAAGEARRLRYFPRGRFPLGRDPNYFRIKTDSFDSRDVAQLLEADALLRAHDGDAEGACDSCRAALNAGRAVGDEPFMASMIRRIGCNASAVSALERTIALGELSDEDLQAVGRLLDEELAEPLLLWGLRGDRAGFHDLSLNLETGTLALESLEDGEDSHPPRGMGQVSNVWVVPRVKKGHAEGLDLLTDAVEAAQLPVERQAPLFAAIEARQAGLSPYAALFFGPFSLAKTAKGFGTNQAQLRCAAAALAAERYRLRHGRWPASVAGLMPDVPLDPFDGKPLRYRNDGEGVIVYSVGPDGIDDGGDRKTLNTHKDGTDIGFRLWDVDRRRRRAE